MSPAPTTAAPSQKDTSQVRQKEMIARHFDRLAAAPDTGAKCAYTFVPGNLTELLLSFDMLPVLPEINALQSAMRGKTAEYIAAAEKLGHSEDVCTYVKSDIGMMKSGNVGPTGQRLPNPDLLLLSYTGCFTFMKWFELLREEYHCPVAMLHVPYQADGRITDAMRTYVVDQLKNVVIPKLEEVTGRKYDEDRLRAHLAQSAQGRGRPGVGAAVREARPVAHRRLLRRGLLRRTDLQRVPRHDGRRGLLPGAARGDRRAHRARARAR